MCEKLFGEIAVGTLAFVIVYTDQLGQDVHNPTPFVAAGRNKFRVQKPLAKFLLRLRRARMKTNGTGRIIKTWKLYSGRLQKVN